MPKTTSEQAAFLADLDLDFDPDAPALVAAEPEPSTLATVVPIPARTTPVLAPAGVDPRLMPVTDIVFDPVLLDGFPDLSGPNMKAASAHVFDLYKSPHRNRDRHSLLHDRIGRFIGQVRKARATGTPLQEHIAASREQRDMAEFLANQGVTTLAELAALITPTNPAN